MKPKETDRAMLALRHMQDASKLDIKALDARRLQALQGWSSFDDDEKRFLAVYGWAGTQEKACAMIGRSKSWASKRAAKNPLFAAAIKERFWTPAEVATRVGEDLIGMSVLALEDVLQNGTDSAKVSASALVLKLNKMMPEQQEDWEDDDEDIIIEIEPGTWLGGKYDYLEKAPVNKKGAFLRGDYWLPKEMKEQADQGLLIQDIDSGEWISVDEKIPGGRYSYNQTYRDTLS